MSPMRPPQRAPLGRARRPAPSTTRPVPATSASPPPSPPQAQLLVLPWALRGPPAPGGPSAGTNNWARPSDHPPRPRAPTSARPGASGRDEPKCGGDAAAREGAGRGPRPSARRVLTPAWSRPARTHRGGPHRASGPWPRRARPRSHGPPAPPPSTSHRVEPLRHQGHLPPPAHPPADTAPIPEAPWHCPPAGPRRRRPVPRRRRPAPWRPGAGGPGRAGPASVTTSTLSPRFSALG